MINCSPKYDITNILFIGTFCDNEVVKDINLWKIFIPETTLLNKTILILKI